MSNTGKKGLRIGKYRITPLGIGVLVAIVAVIVVAVVLSLTGDKADRVSSTAVTPTASPTAEVQSTPTPTVQPTATAKPEPTATPEPEPRSATIRVLGEISMEMDLLKSAYNATDKTFDFSPMFSEIADVIGDADYTIADVEGTMGDTKSVGANESTRITPSALLNALSASGVDMLMMANDHVLDGGLEDMKATIANIASAGMDYVGAGASAEEKSSPVVVDVNGISVGFVAYCDSMSAKVSDDAAACISLISNSDAASDVQKVRDAGAEIVIALVNWGEMYSHTPNSTQQKIAKILTDIGTDVIIGYNPHAVQPVYWLESTAADGSANRTLCICAPGSLLSNQTKAGTDCGAIFEFTLSEQEDGSIAVESPEYIPTYTLRTKRADGLYDYRAVVIGRYTAEGAALADGMSAADVEYMIKLQSAIQSVVGTDVAQMVSE